MLCFLGDDSYAHQLAYQLAIGPIPQGLWIDHTCRNRWCVNAAHLEAVPPLVNSLRGDHPLFVARRNGTCTKGHPMDKLYIIKDKPHRRCRTCQNEWQRQYHERRRKERKTLG